MTGSLVTALLAAFGVDFPLLWGLLTFLAHYIPSVGAVISVGLPTIFLFLQFSPGTALLIALLNAALQFIMGNAVEPRIMGSSLDLSPLLVLIALIFWGWLWGPWGMMLVGADHLDDQDHLRERRAPAPRRRADERLARSREAPGAAVKAGETLA